MLRLSFSFGTHPPNPELGLVVTTRCLTWGAFWAPHVPIALQSETFTANPSKMKAVRVLSHFIYILPSTYIGECENFVMRILCLHMLFESTSILFDSTFVLSFEAT